MSTNEPTSCGLWKLLRGINPSLAEGARALALNDSIRWVFVEQEQNALIIRNATLTTTTERLVWSLLLCTNMASQPLQYQSPPHHHSASRSFVAEEEVAAAVSSHTNNKNNTSHTSSSNSSSNSHINSITTNNNKLPSPKRKQQQLPQPRSPSLHEEHKIRRGAEIIRHQIQAQLSLLTNAAASNATTSAQQEATPAAAASRKEECTSSDYNNTAKMSAITPTSATASAVNRHTGRTEPDRTYHHQSISSSSRTSPNKNQQQSPRLSSPHNYRDSCHPWNDEHRTTPPITHSTTKRRMSPLVFHQSDNATNSSSSDSRKQEYEDGRRMVKPLELQLDEIIFGPDDDDDESMGAEGERGGDTSSHSILTDFSDPWNGNNTTANMAATALDTFGGTKTQQQQYTKKNEDSKHTTKNLLVASSATAVEPTGVAQTYGFSSSLTAIRRRPSDFVSSDDDSDSDICEVNEPMFDPFYERDLLPAEKSIQTFLEEKSLVSPVSPIRSSNVMTAAENATISTAAGRNKIPTDVPLFRSEDVFTFQDGDHAVVVTPPDQQQPPKTVVIHSERQQPPESSSSSGGSSSSGPMYPQLNIATALDQQNEEETHDNDDPRDGEEFAYDLPKYLESPEKIRSSLKLPDSSLMDCIFDDERNCTDQYDSPEKNCRPVSEVPLPLCSPASLSQLSTPDKSLSPKWKPSVILEQYNELVRDPAYTHAQNAGYIWQSIVGQHVHFPKQWWNGARGPPTGEEGLPWMYFGRHTVHQNIVLNQLVKGRASGGRLLLHVIVQDLVTRTPIQDITIGCFHPNAKGIRREGPPLKRLEDCRDIWMAIRKRNHQSVAATDSLLYSQSNWDGNHSMCRSPLGPGQRVTNTNIRSVFGDKAPLETIFLSEGELYERLSSRITQLTLDGAVSPPLAILQEFVFA